MLRPSSLCCVKASTIRPYISIRKYKNHNHFYLLPVSSSPWEGMMSLLKVQPLHFFRMLFWFKFYFEFSMTVLILQHCLRKKDLRDARIKYLAFAFANFRHFTALASKSRTELNWQGLCLLDGLWDWFSNLDFSKNENRSLLESGFQNSVFKPLTALRR